MMVEGGAGVCVEWNETAPGTKRRLGSTPHTTYLRDTHAVRVISVLSVTVFNIKQI